MKKTYWLIGGLAVAAVFVTFGMVSWNEKVKITSESAKEKIEIVKKTDPELTGDAPLNRNDSEESTDGQPLNGKASDGKPNEKHSHTDDGATGHGISGNSDPQNDHGENPASIDPVPPIAPAEPGTALADIKAAYRGVFSELEVLQGSKVDQVVVQAKADYVSGKYMKEDLIVKYQEIALSLESQADQAFHAIYQQLEADLEENGHDVSEAVSLRSEYNQKKNERLSHVISKLSAF